MSLWSRAGESLLELLIALIVLEIAGAAALASALTAERLGRHAVNGAAEDARRWQVYRDLETAPACVAAASPDTVVHIFDETADRPRLVTVHRCGR